MDRTVWDTAFRKYELAALLQDACRDFGPEFQINEKYIREEWALEATHGKRATICLNSDAPKEFYAMDMQREQEIEALTPIYYDPALTAAQTLVMTPAPDIAAMRFKVDLVNNLDLECYPDTENVFEVVRADVERLGREAAGCPESSGGRMN